MKFYIFTVLSLTCYQLATKTDNSGKTDQEKRLKKELTKQLIGRLKNSATTDGAIDKGNV